MNGDEGRLAEIAVPELKTFGHRTAGRLHSVANIMALCELTPMADAKLLSEPTNYAVVHLPGRAFPGVVFQGDRLHILIGDLQKVALETDEGERAFALKEVLERLTEVRRFYEQTLDREGIPTPYTRGQGR